MLWDAVPVVLKAKPHLTLGLARTDPADAVAAHGAAAADCAVAYELTYGLEVGLGVEDVAVPEVGWVGPV